MRLKLLIVATVSLISSCTYYQNSYLGPTANTNVVLSSNKFKVVGSVSGNANAKYVFFITKDKQNLYTVAREDLMSKAKVYNRSRAIINFTVDKARSGFFPIYYKDIVYISGELIEFIDSSAIGTTTDGVQSVRQFSIKPGALCEIHSKDGEKYSGIIDLTNDVYTIVIDTAGKKQVLKTKDITEYLEN